jgi:sterol carrier protein 2
MAETFALARISVKSRAHAAMNPLALFNQAVTEEQVLGSRHDGVRAAHPLQCCPPTCGAAAAVLCSEDYAARHGIDAGVHRRTGHDQRRPGSFA